MPTTNDLLNSLYEAKKTLGALRMKYEKILACLIIVVCIGNNLLMQLNVLIMWSIKVEKR